MRYWIVDFIAPSKDESGVINCCCVKVTGMTVNMALSAAERALKDYDRYLITGMGIASEFSETTENEIFEDPIGLMDEDIQELAKAEGWV